MDASVPMRFAVLGRPELADVLIDWALSRDPDVRIGPDYLHRWYVVPRNLRANVYLHRFLASDDDRALHDHPWPSTSLCLRGFMYEYCASGPPRKVMAGDVIDRPATWAHRLELIPGTECWTLFATGAVEREWGFCCPSGWRHWRDFVDEADHGRVGKGCE